MKLLLAAKSEIARYFISLIELSEYRAQKCKTAVLSMLLVGICILFPSMAVNVSAQTYWTPLDLPGFTFNSDSAGMRIAFDPQSSSTIPEFGSYAVQCRRDSKPV